MFKENVCDQKKKRKEKPWSANYIMQLHTVVDQA
jgi:hypothetical protein